MLGKKVFVAVHGQVVEQVVYQVIEACCPLDDNMIGVNDKDVVACDHMHLKV
jgi:hypothetical protein